MRNLHLSQGKFVLKLALLAGVVGGAAAGCVARLGTIPGEDIEQDAGTSSSSAMIRRLNRAEYSNTMRDLLGEPLRVGDTLPADETNSLGYDNDGTSLAASPLLVERWVDVAERAVESYFARLSPAEVKFKILNLPCTGLRPGLDACGQSNGFADGTYYGMRPAEETVVVEGLTIPADGIYTISFKAFATPTISTLAGGATAPGQPYPVLLKVSVDGVSKTFDITKVAKSAAQTFDYTLELTHGKHSLEFKSLPDITNPDNQDGNWYEHSAWVDEFRIAGPGARADTPKAPKYLDCDATQEKCVRGVLENFAHRAWRRPVASDELDQLVAIARNPTTSGQDADAAVRALAGLKLAFQAVLVSPHFLYRPEVPPKSGGAQVSDFELASRLSYFLWGSMPDDELYGVAQSGKLVSELDKQVDRMLADPKAQSLTDDFAGQWLNLRRLSSLSLLPEQFPDFTPEVKAAMGTETSLYFAEFLKSDERSFVNMLDADFTFANSTLATYYGLPADGLTADKFVQIPLAGTQRLGLLSQGTFLTTTSHPNRTSPVLRGKFVLRQLLCSPPPDPPADIPPFNEDASAGTVRQRLEKHRESPSCSICHERMDSVGFSLENFDAAAKYRTQDGGQDIDTTKLELDGVAIHDVASLAKAVQENSLFVPCVVRQLYSYALGREVGNRDESLLNLGHQTEKDGYVLKKLIHRIVTSDTFRSRGGN